MVSALNDMTSTAASNAQDNLMRVEAARYALLRRLAFSIRHQMVAHLQPIGMVTELLERRLRAPTPDLHQAHDSVAKINGLSKAAAHDCLDVITWMAPEPGATVPVGQAVQDCMVLLRGNFSFRGLSLRSDLPELPQPVGRSAARMLLSACLLALTDPLDGPAEVTISAQANDELATVDLRVQRTEGDGYENQLNYRALLWPDVQAMAQAEDVELAHTESTARLTFAVLD
ncbi:hypothetical protein PE066_10715 [Ramlibacter tataouinensis]|uniref:hypothetical protein n=1 Tax=Ramlibacter tataouinensis TaxID=94132 RepID=UPI0022F3C199|nr:hypothetical protein [Ramlibacter tataouinensis]WBX99958.1 hypothetical protein PE066_10715 [Ramlibacter tataouinensis]